MEIYDVVIAGGGYAGVMCAVRLAGRFRGSRLRIALVNPVPEFVERLRLHEGIASEQARSRTLDIPSFLTPSGIAFIAGKVIELDREARTVRISTHSSETCEVGYERFVAAAGSSNRCDLIPGADRHAFVLDPSGNRSFQDLRRRLSEQVDPCVVIVGGGSTAIELAAELAQDKMTSVQLVSAGPLARFAEEPIRRYIRRELDALDVVITEGATVTGITDHEVLTSIGKMTFDVCVTCTGFTVPSFLQSAGLETGKGGRILADAYLRATNDARVFLAGDCCLPAAPVGAPPRMSVMFALASGAHVADTITDELAGRVPRRFGFWTYGRAIGLGAHAIGYNTIPFDTPLRPFLTGRVGNHVRHFFIWLLFSLLKVARVWPSVPFWLGRPLRRGGKKRGAGNVNVFEHGS